MINLLDFAVETNSIALVILWVDFTDVFFSEAVLELYKSDDVLISNHSYGYSQKDRLAEYDSVAATQDLTVVNNPYLNIFEAAGNDGVDSSYGDYGIIKGPGNSKNIFTIGALSINSKNIAELSSTGPVNDGRIKPDLCTRGEYITSTTDESNSGYAMMSGTSMASPSATGVGVLATQAYRRVTGGDDIRHDVLKSILVNTAEDIENPGPDYKAGFGMINAKAAVDVINTLGQVESLIHSGSVKHAEGIVYTFDISESGDFKTTLSWVDPQANPSSAITLVNDIDMLLENVDTGVKYYPYTLDKNNPNKKAVQTKANHVDNIEQIEVKNMPAGTYKLAVNGTTITTKRQEFCLVSNQGVFKTSNISTLAPSEIQNFARKIFTSTL